MASKVGFHPYGFSFQSADGIVILAAGPNITLLPSGNQVTISATVPPAAIPTPPKTVTDTYQMLSGDTVVLVNNLTGGPVTITGPKSPTPGVLYTILDVGNNAATDNITYMPFSGNIATSSNFVIKNNLGGITWLSDGANQWIVGLGAFALWS